MVTWPLDLPQKQFLGLTDQDKDSVLRTPMDTGPESRRSRWSASVRVLEVPIVLTGAQKDSFNTFYRTDLLQGALAFDWEDPDDDTIIEMSFRKPTKLTLAVGGPPAERKWNGVMALQIEP